MAKATKLAKAMYRSYHSATCTLKHKVKIIDLWKHILHYFQGMRVNPCFHRAFDSTLCGEKYLKNSAHYCAFRYLNIWLEHDRRWHDAVTNGERTQRLAALQEAAASYKVARTATKAFDVDRNLPRFQPVLDILDRVVASDFDDDAVGNVLRIHQKISSKYGGANVLSLTTKMLWIKVRSPIIIYDQQARKSLGTRNGDLAAFYIKWQEQYELHHQEISVACEDLHNMARYVHDQAADTPGHIKSVASQPWFKHRVFDLMLWKNNGHDRSGRETGTTLLLD